MDRNIHLEDLLQVDAEQIDVHQIAFNGMVQPIHHHHRLRGGIAHGHVKDGVVAGIGTEDLVDLLRTDGDGDGIFSGAVNDRGHHTADPQTAGFVLTPGGARCGGDGNFFSHTDLWLKRMELTV